MNGSEHSDNGNIGFVAVLQASVAGSVQRIQEQCCILNMSRVYVVRQLLKAIQDKESSNLLSVMRSRLLVLLEETITYASRHEMAFSAPGKT
jgi:hypothetical protein